MARNASVVLRGHPLHRYALGVVELEADNLRALADMFGPRDGAFQELMDLADAVDARNEEMAS